MKPIRLVLAIIVALAVGGLSFYVYGAVRTMQENIGLAARPLLVSAAFPLVILAAAVAIVMAARSFTSGRPAISKRTIVLFAGGWLLGCSASEACILNDERAFAHELSLRPRTESYSRPRTWPNEACSLVFIPGRGIHATD
jgi:hypothetical protein